MYAIELIDVPAQPTAVLKGKVKRQDISAWMGSAFGQVWSSMTASGLVPTGPPFSRYFSIDEEFDLEAVNISLTVSCPGYRASLTFNSPM